MLKKLIEMTICRKKSLFLLLLPLLISACEIPDTEQRRIAMHLPPVGFSGNPDYGRSLFNNYCAGCHGLRGLGTQQGPPLMHQTYRSDHHADFVFHMAVRDGVRSHHWGFGDMKPLPNVTPEATEHIIAYIRQEQRKKGISPSGDP